MSTLSGGTQTRYKGVAFVSALKDHSGNHKTPHCDCDGDDAKQSSLLPPFK